MTGKRLQMHGPLQPAAIFKSQRWYDREIGTAENTPQPSNLRGQWLLALAGAGQTNRRQHPGAIQVPTCIGGIARDYRSDLGRNRYARLLHGRRRLLLESVTERHDGLCALFGALVGPMVHNYIAWSHDCRRSRLWLT